MYTGTVLYGAAARISVMTAGAAVLSDVWTAAVGVRSINMAATDAVIRRRMCRVVCDLFAFISFSFLLDNDG
jgi:hypothetical protein